MRKVVLSVLIAISPFVGFSSRARTNGMECDSDSCEFWQAKADATLPRSKAPDPDLTDSTIIMAAIECLLKMEGNKHKAAFSGAMKYYVSQNFENTPADVAALYYISYLYYQKYDHADAVALRGKDGSVNTPEVVSKAYRGYKKWFEKVKSVGLEKAREMKLDPLKSTKVRWY
jgi:hypothetical protein